MEPFIAIRDNKVRRQIQELNLMSMERLDRSSPELWPECVPGMESYPLKPAVPIRPPQWMGEFDQADMNLLLVLSEMSATNLVLQVKKLFDAAYSVGRVESKEVTRGKYLQVLIKKEKAETSQKE